MSMPTPPFPGTEGSGPDQDAAISHIESDIENTREELGETAEALAGKLDVKAQAEKKAEELKSQIGTRVADATRQVTESRKLQLFAAVGFVGVAVLGILMARGRRKVASRSH